MKKIISIASTTLILSMLFSINVFAASPTLTQWAAPRTANGEDLAVTPASEAAKAQAQQVISTIITPGMTDLQKITAVHDYIVLHTKYAEGSSAHFADGPILYGTGVCDGYAAAFKCYMDLLGIPCQLLVSDSMDHTWNQVTVGGVPYEVDVTFDDYLISSNGVISENGLSHNTFMLSSAQMIDQHIIEYFGTLSVNMVLNPDGSWNATW